MPKTAVHKFATIKGVEIFQVGTWNGKPYTHEDLAEIERNFQYLFPRGLEPPVVVGHEEPGEEGNFLDNSGIPAAAWVRNLRKVGATLVCDFIDMPALIAALIKARRYKKISCEIAASLKDANSGKTFKNVLWRVAILGGDIPAVESLQDIPLPMHRDIAKFTVDKKHQTITFSTEDDMGKKVKFQADPAAPADDAPDGDDGGNEVLKAISDLGDRLTGVEQSLTDVGERLATLEGKTDEGDDGEKGGDAGTTDASKNASDREKELAAELAAERKKNTEQMARLDTIEQERFSERVKADVERLKKAGKFLPALEEAGATKFMASLNPRTVVHKFRKDGVAVEQTQYDQFVALFDALAEGALVKFGETAANGENADAPDAPSGKFDPDSEKMNAKIIAFQKKQKIKTFSEAVSRYSAAQKASART